MILLLQLPGCCDFSIGGFADSKWIMHVTTLILMDSSPDKAPLHIPCSLAVRARGHSDPASSWFPSARLADHECVYTCVCVCTCTWASQMVLEVKNPPTNAGGVRHLGLIPGSGRSPGGGHGNLLQYSCLENPTDRGAWRAIVHRVTKTWTGLKRLSMHACM